MLPESILKRCITTHGALYDYTNYDYRMMNSKSTIVCHIHGAFDQSMSTHLYKKSGCPKCGDRRAADTRGGSFQRWNTPKFIERANQVHNNRYDYSLTQYVNAHTHVEIICAIHGSWWMTPSVHLRANCGFGCGCPICSDKMSAPERLIYDTLTDNHINFKYQQSFTGLKSSLNRPLYFDFYLPDCNILIEYDGQHHTAPHPVFNTDVHRIVELDSVKTHYALQHNMKLIRIPVSTSSKLKNEIINIIRSSFPH